MSSFQKQNRQNKLLTAPLVIVGLFLFSIQPLFAAPRNYNPNNIITDAEMFDSSSLSQAAIQSFLTEKNSVLANYMETVDGVSLYASEMIHKVSVDHGVNPKFILTNLEKEQALISRSTATQKALDWATGYSCYGGTCRDKYKGFYNQIGATAETQEIYKNRAGQFGFRVGVTTETFDGYQLTPENQATANLFIYTPHVGNSPELGVANQFGGNRLFWRVWHRYFSSQKFVTGQIITDGSRYWQIRDGKKLAYASSQIFLADHNPSEAIFVNSNDLAAYPDGPTIALTDKSVARASGSGQLFYIDGFTKRPIIDSSALAKLTEVRFASTEQEVAAVPDNYLLPYAVGELITSASVAPAGQLYQSASGSVWLVKNGLKHPVDPIVKQNRFGNQSVQSITQSELDAYPNGQPILLKDGTFVVNNGTYYLISDGYRMKIASAGVFERVFGVDKMNAALAVNTTVLNYHAAGELIDYIDDTITGTSRPTPTPTPAPIPTGNTYAASFVDVTPKDFTVITGQKLEVTVRFKNTGTSTWTPQTVTLKATDSGSTANSFGSPTPIPVSGNVAPGETGSFIFTITAPQTPGLVSQDFTVYQSNNALGTVGKFILVKSGLSAQVVEHTIPIATKNIWGPITVKVKIKNTSLDTIWLSRKTALEVYNNDGTPSMFYDKNDWVRREIAAVPINKTSIKPGEIGEFVFTLNAKGLKKGTYALNFKLNLLDKNKQVYLSGSGNWQRLIRVD